MEKELEQLKKFFLSKDLDDEDYQDNLDLINGWEKNIRENEDFASWQTSDITKSIVEQAIKSYKELAMSLIEKRDLTEKERLSIYSKQDACLWLLSLVYKDVKSNIETIRREIQQTLKVVDN